MFPALLLGLAAPATAQLQATTSASPIEFAIADQIVDEFRLDAHIPGIVYGIVADGRLVHVATFGVQDIESARPVTADTLFRVASMTKAFTALTVLKLRDDGLVRLEAPAAEYVPEMRSWKYPTEDSPAVRVRDLLNHTGGFVTDDPWGDRQTSLPENEFTQLLRDGVPFTSVPATRYEYSNLGYAILGRIITNVSGQPYAATISRTLLQPLGMNASGFMAEQAPQDKRALGYRWEDDRWKLEPTLGPGAFGAMGGLQTSANDYARWVTYLLSAWPPRDGLDDGPVRRATVRELVQGSNYPRLRDRIARTGTTASRQSANYGMGVHVAIDDDLGFTVSHSGGYPGFGSHVLLLPDRGIGIFAFANRTYAGPSVAVWDAAIALNGAGLLGKERELPTSADLESAYRAAGMMYRSGDVTTAREHLAMNFLLDRDADGWSSKLAKLKAEVGECETTAPITATGTLSGDFTWRCSHGRIEGSLTLAPTRPALIQEWQLERIVP
ncbi:MAG: class A beta-lactamase-related serine hydrolase [Acidobacteria bacterium]|nr:MAG: class A beta-lactamase-related serine hydrolase [Acidobacteriota bacterium]